MKEDRGGGEGLGIFRTWRALYAAVIGYTIALIVLLYVLTRMLDFSVP